MVIRIENINVEKLEPLLLLVAFVGVIMIIVGAVLCFVGIPGLVHISNVWNISEPFPPSLRLNALIGLRGEFMIGIGALLLFCVALGYDILQSGDEEARKKREEKAEKYGHIVIEGKSRIIFDAILVIVSILVIGLLIAMIFNYDFPAY